ncbi:MAG TPA: MATE family efflux transporter [Rhizobiales bacterium]|nr:DNA-damage-inducible protein F [bacterium BMS3Bbin10]HDO52938.1 MATE family efflux transporter [Hyphomicrobiales bacterium]
MTSRAAAGDGPEADRPGADRLGHAHVLAIAVPIVLANVTTPLIGLVDTAVLGQLGDPHYIGGIAIGAMIFNLLYWAFGFLRMGTTGLTAQAEGGGDTSAIGATLLRALLIAAIAGTLLIIFQLPISAISFALVKGSQAVEASAAAYFDIRIWGAPAALVNFAFLGWFIGMGRARTALVLQLLLNGTNAILDAWFVLGLGLAVEGVAYATLISQLVAAAAGVWLGVRVMKSRGIRFHMPRILHAEEIRRTIAVNGDIMIRTISVVFAFTWFTAKSAEAGDVVLAANAVLLTLTYTAAYFLDGFAFAAETLVGQAIGAKRIARFRDAVRLSTLWAVVLSTLAGAVFWFGGGVIIDILTVNEEVRASARDYLVWAALVPVTGVMAYQLDGIFIGATRTADMRNMMLLSLAAFLVAWMALTPAYGNHGLWAALVIFMSLRGLTLGLRYPALVRAAFPASRAQTIRAGHS